MRAPRRSFGKYVVVAFIALSALLSTAGAALEYVINPSDDGSVTRSRVDTNDYLISDFGEWGVAEFSLAVIPPDVEIASAMFSINPYGLPLNDSGIMISAYESEDGILTTADYRAGVYLGTIRFPEDVRWGEEGFQDVTEFMQSVDSPYVGFRLTTVSLDIFSSLEYNYGKPAQLTITLVPEPASLTLLSMGLCVLLRRLPKNCFPKELKPAQTILKQV